ncbi:Alpha/Beta hydrolase protein [Mycena maculata]|uniref:Carboxylic ester hydrolase n=1 Tax=Mycena maculata TaxID=230809 RepID=A0AAD7HEY8_9AGAR|nr:Alpha/Beta hydrolase protein [Mycena maculata]
MVFNLVVVFSIFLSGIAASDAGPIVSLPYGSFQGFNSGNLTKYLGVPFAQAYVSGRFELPSAPGLFDGVQNATEFGPTCPQQALSVLPVAIPFDANTHLSISENCLSLNVFKPIASNASSKLPVFVWLFGGGFEVGDSNQVDVSPLAERSIERGEPVIIVTPNYRLSAFGFLAGEKVASAGVTNLALRDQIFALQWVQQHIAAFGGDPDPVVLGGVSAGAISTALLLLSNKQNSNTLFHGAFMATGSPFTTPSVTDGQSDYDGLVAANNCTLSEGTLNCLRKVPLDAFWATVYNTANFFSYRSVSFVWGPRVDGDVIVNNPLVSVSRGLYSKVPFLTGDCDDEGNIFSVAPYNVTTSQEFLDYVHTYLLPGASVDQLAQVGRIYPDDTTQGSPFGTGTADQLTPEFKCLAAFQGDFLFMGPRRGILQLRQTRTQTHTWSWCIKRGKNSSVFGAFHASDIVIWFLNTTDTTGADALNETWIAIKYINTLDPNRAAGTSTANSSIFWPKWNTPSSTGPTSLLTFSEPEVVNITTEDFRVDAIQYLNNLLSDEALAK